MKNPFVTPTATDLARKDLEQAQRDLLAADAALEHWKYQSLMLRERVARLQTVVEPGRARQTTRPYPNIDVVPA